VHNAYAAVQVDIEVTLPTLSDVCCVDVGLHKKLICVVCVYRPPGTGIEASIDTNLLVNCISDLARSHKGPFVLLGDQNLPLALWHAMDGPRDGVHNVILNGMIDLSLRQIIDKLTRHENILYVICISDTSLIPDFSNSPKLGAICFIKLTQGEGVSAQ